MRLHPDFSHPGKLPQGPIKVDWSRLPFGSRVWNLRTPARSDEKKLPFTLTGDPYFTRQGWYFDGSDDYIRSTVTEPNYRSRDFSVILVGTITDHSNLSYVCGGQGVGWQWSCAPEQWSNTGKVGANVNGALLTSALDTPYGRRAAYGWAFNSTQTIYALDGVLDITSQSNAISGSGNTTFTIGRRNTINSDYSQGHIELVILIPKAVSASKLASLTHDPYQIFKPAIPTPLIASAAANNIAANTEALTLTTYAASITQAANVDAGPERLTLTTYTATVDGAQAAVEAITRSGGWLPVIYVDEDGNPVDLEEIKETVAEAVEVAAEDRTPRQAANIRKSAERALAALSAAQAARVDDIGRLRAALKESQAALTALNRAVEAQRQEEDALTLLLLH